MNGDRYSRQILFEGIGREGQEALWNTRILVVGCGALGASHSEMLARAGCGFLRIVDRDFVELSNLQRQTLFTESDAEARLPKAAAAKNRLEKVNSEIEIDARIADLNYSNAEELISDADLVIDGSDNFQVRYLVNDVCVKLGKPWIYGAAVSSYGTTMTIRPGETPCLRCIFGEMPAAGSAPTCDTAGLMQIDIWRNDWRRINLRAPDAGCVCCGKREFEFLAEDNQEVLTSLCGRNAVQILPAGTASIDLSSFGESLGRSVEVESNEYLVRFSVDGKTVTLFRDARAIIQGTDDPSEARAIYSRFIGN
jgi:molybdopterin/thiamine biosynthesis adenylyltransferase